MEEKMMRVEERHVTGEVAEERRKVGSHKYRY